MFEGRRHVTSGVRERIGPDTQVLIWGLIDSLRASSASGSTTSRSSNWSRP